MSTFESAVRAVVRDEFSQVNIALPGRIESYDAAESRADVKPLLKRVYLDGKIQELPVIVNVPVVIPGTAGASLILPIAAGDTVLLVFAQRAIDEWLSKGGIQPPSDRRRFALTDAIAIPGLFPFVGTRPTLDGTSAGLVNKGAKLKLQDDGKIAIGNASAELVDIVEKILTLLTTATCASPGSILVHTILEPAEGSLVDIQAKLLAIKGTL